MKDEVIINEKDNVGITLTGKDNIPAGHKFALKDIKKANTLLNTVKLSEGRLSK